MRAGGLSLEGLRARFRELHGARRESLAWRLALLASASAVLEGHTARRARAERLFALAWQQEEMRLIGVALVQWGIAMGRGRSEEPSRPAWLASTWRAQSDLALAIAEESEWFDFVGGLLVTVGRGVDDVCELRARSRPAVVMFGDDGEAKTLFLER